MPKTAKRVGSVRSKAGLPAKAGKRRPPNIHSTRDADGKRQWVTGLNPEAEAERREKVKSEEKA